MPVLEHAATPETFDALVLQARDELVVVDFWGDGCPNCDVFAAAKPELLRSLEGTPVRIVTVDAYTHPELARRFALFGIPAFLLFRDGVLLGRMSQFHGKEYWLRVVEEHLPTPAASH